MPLILFKTSDTSCSYKAEIKHQRSSAVHVDTQLSTEVQTGVYNEMMLSPMITNSQYVQSGYKTQDKGLQ